MPEVCGTSLLTCRVSSGSRSRAKCAIVYKVRALIEEGSRGRGMLEASCHCGAVRLEIDSTPPAEVNDCRCSICRRYGALWAYYAPERVRVVLPFDTPTDVYVWGDRTLTTHRCR